MLTLSLRFDINGGLPAVVGSGEEISGVHSPVAFDEKMVAIKPDFLHRTAGE